MNRKRVVITGMGTLNPLANNVEDTWKTLKEGKCGVGPITHFDASDFSTKIAGEVKDFIPSDYMDKKEARKLARFSQFAVAAAVMAMRDAGLEEGGYDPERSGCIMGNGIGGFEVVEDSMKRLFARGPAGIPPMTIPKMIANEGPANVAIKFNLLGPCLCITTACASANDAMGIALQNIRAGVSDMVVTGGMEAAITPFSIGGFNKIQALSTNNDNPIIASRPFDKDRDGFIMSEGAGVLVFEELEHALKRGAKIYAEIAGYGMTCDAFHLTAPHSEGLGGARAMKLALADAGMQPEDIDYINAHGTSTPTNDPIETKAIKSVFGDYAYDVTISSTKSQTGHMVGGAGGIEGIISALAIRDQYLPGTLNLKNPAEGCDLNYNPGVGKESRVKTVLSNSLGFGGHNGTAIFKEYTE